MKLKAQLCVNVRNCVGNMTLRLLMLKLNLHIFVRDIII